MLTKYPRTWHLPYSLGKSDDDKVLDTTNHFVGKEIVITEKLDGECTGLTSEVCHARSLDSRDHSSRHWVKQLHGKIKSDIPIGWTFYGENLFASHSIFYRNLPSYFFLFAVLDGNKYFVSWDEVKEWSKLLDLQTVPELYRGNWDEELVKQIWTGKSNFGGEGEGCVIRVADAFCFHEFASCVCKWVRALHVTTSQHWMQEKIVPNQLLISSD